MNPDIKILVVDDEEDIVEFLSYNLDKEGYIVETASDGNQALEKAKVFDPHLIVLDIMMPDKDGIEVCDALRSDDQFKNTLIAFLTARNESYPDLQGADGNEKKVFGDLEINFADYRITKGGKDLKLAKKEFDLLALLASRPGKVFKRFEIMSKVWGSEVIVGDRTIDVHIRKLREKIGSNYIYTLKGVGYKFDF